jgi:hypothetical protein
MATTPSGESDKAKQSLKEVGEVVNAIDESFRELTSRITDVVKEIAEGSSELTSFNNVTKDINRSLRSMNKVNEDLIKNQIKLNQGKLSSKQIDEQINKAVATRQILAGRLESLQKKMNSQTSVSITEHREVVRLQKAIAEISEEVEGNFRKQKDAAVNLEKTLGLTGKTLKGISKIPIIGDLVDTDAALQAATKAAQNGAGSIGAMGAAIGSLGKSLVSSLMDPAAQISLLTKGFSAFFDLLMESDKATGELAKGMNMSYNDASKLRGQYAEIAKNAHDSYITTKGLQESQLAIAQTLGTTAKLNEQDLKTFNKLRDQAGYTNEELASMERLTLAIGGNLEGNVKSFAGTVAKLNLQNKLTVNEKQLLKDVSKVSDAIKLSVGGTVENIAKAAFKAKQFGINLEQADQISQSLLNFEESIESQISAELLTGKQLNLEKARLLALNGDIAGASAEILEQVGGTAEFSAMNRIQQEAIAKAVGLSRDDLAKSLVEREALQKIGAKDAEEAEKKYRILRQTMTAEEAAKALGDEAYARQLEQTTVAEDFNQLVLQLKELFIPIAQELLPKIKELLGPEGGVGALVEKIKSSFDTIKTVVEVIIGLIGLQLVTSLVSATAQAVKLVSTLGKANVGGGGGLGGLLKGGKLGKLAKGGGLLSLASAGIDLGTNLMDPNRSTGNAVAKTLDQNKFMALGAGIGSIVPGVGTLVGAGIGGLADMFLGSSTQMVDDAMIGPDGGLIVSGKKGMYSLNSKDYVVSGTGLGANNNTTSTSNIDVLLEEQKRTNALLERQNNISNVIANKNTNVQYDSQMAGTAADVNSYRIGSQFITN